MVDEERCELVVCLEDSAEAYLESLVETLSEDSEDSDYGACARYDELDGVFEAVPSEHHERDGGGEERECHQRGEVEGETTLHVACHCLGCRTVGVTHAFAYRVVVVMTLEEHGAERGREGKGVERGDTDGDRHCETELAVEHTCGAAHERYRDEHEHHHEGDRDDGSAYLAHCVDRCLARALVAHVEFGVDRLDHHYGVVDHNGYRKHKG